MVVKGEEGAASHLCLALVKEKRTQVGRSHEASARAKVVRATRASAERQMKYSGRGRKDSLTAATKRSERA